MRLCRAPELFVDLRRFGRPEWHDHTVGQNIANSSGDIDGPFIVQKLPQIRPHGPTVAAFGVPSCVNKIPVRFLILLP